MKSFRILAVALSLLSLPTANVSAQVGIALTRGINRGSWDSDVHSFFKKDQRSITRSSTGLTATIPLRGSLAIEFGGAYSQKGARVEVTGSGRAVRQTVTFEVDYLELTALGRVNQPLVENRVLAFVVAGPAVAWKLSHCQFSYEPPDLVNTCPTRGHPYMAEYYSLDYGAAYGGGLEVGLTEDLGVTLGVVNTVGLRNLLADKNNRYNDHLKLRTMTYRGGIVYWIG